jgi:hypothetical protein
MEHPRADYRRCSATLPAMRLPVSMKTLATTVALGLVALFLWVVLLGPAALILLRPQA